MTDDIKKNIDSDELDQKHLKDVNGGNKKKFKECSICGYPNLPSAYKCKNCGARLS